MKNSDPLANELEQLRSLFQQNRFTAGEALARSLSHRAPENAYVWKSLGVCLTLLGRKSEAVAAMMKSAALNPSDAEIHFNLGTTLNEQKRWNEAERCLRRAIEQKPDYVEAYNNLGDTLTHLNRLPEAAEVFRQAIQQRPDGVEAYYNLGNALRQKGRYGEAEDSFRAALQRQPEHVEVRHNLGFLLLSLGRYGEGWPYYEARYHPKKIGRSITPPRFAFPQWQGESLLGKSLLVWPEQGFGDEIQFARYSPLLKAKGVSRLTLACKAPLNMLLQTLAGVDAIIVRDEPMPAHDYWVFALSLPLYLDTTLETIPSTLPYLSAEPQRIEQWRPRLPQEGFKVGLVWRGNAGHKNDVNRSLTHFATLAPLWSVPGVRFVSLQKGTGEEKADEKKSASPAKGQPIVRLGAEIQDFADTAAIVAQLDLVICVDTAVAHLAGALGKPCWVLLPAVGTDWRWLHERSDSPWYPGTMRLFRQRTAGNWEETIADVAQALSAWLRDRSKQPRTALPAPLTLTDAEIAYLSALFEEKRFADGSVAADEIVRRHPHCAFAWYVLGVCLMSMGRKADALAPMQRAAELDANNPEVHCNLGIALKQQGRLPDAERSYRRAIELKTDYVEAHYNLGIALNDQERYGEAEKCYRRVIELQRKHVNAHLNLGNVLQAQGRRSEAENSYRQAIELRPDAAPAHYNLGMVLGEQGRYAEAESSYRRAIELAPDYHQAHGNLGNTLEELSRFGEAENSYRRAIELKPDYAPARTNLGILLLSLGRYREGWPYYEARYDPAQRGRLVAPPQFPFPQWQGEPLTGKSLLIWPEQGFGDEIQFARYGALLKTLGVSRLTLVCQPALKTLLHSLVGVDAVIAQGDPLPHHDYWSFPLSLPLRCGTRLENIPAKLPYLSADPQRIERWRPALKKNIFKYENFKVGLVWRGATGHRNDAHRSLPGLATLAPLWSVSGVRFISLQKGAGEEEANSPPAGQPILPLGPEIHDFADSAAIVAQLDLVICVDTSIAHLAGALGQPCWVMLPAVGTDWRWLHEQSDSPWYPDTMRLFRQTSAGDWGAPVAEVAKALRERVAASAPSSVTSSATASATSAPHAISDEIAALNTVTANPPPEEIDRLISLYARQRFDEGRFLAIALTERYPSNSFAWKALGACLTLAGRKEEAVEPMRKAALLNPDDLEGHRNLAIALKQQDRMTEAEHSYRQIVRLQPDHVDAHTNLGRILSDRGLFAAAENSYRRALELKPDRFRLHGNLGNVLKAQGRLDEAENSYRRALALKPDYAQAGSNLGILLLSLGRYTEGWPYYEARYNSKLDKKWIALPELPFPQWQGESLLGKSILLWPEQGLGDEIQFARYAPLLKERGVSRLTLVCTPPLKTLLQTVAGVDRVITQGEPIPQHDYWAFPLSLPLHLETTLASIPVALPYLSADPQRVRQWQACLPEDGLKVGLVWRGNAQHPNDAHRSLPGLATLAPLWSVPGVRFISLQKGAGEEEANTPPAGQLILPLGPEIHDFADTAAIVAQLDLVICVDTSITHLAGALGQSCWVMLPAVGTDWRWLHERSDSPWYPGTMRLFRQTSAGDWGAPVAEVAKALRERVENLQGEKQRAAASVVAAVASSATSAPHAISDETAAPNTVTANPPPEEIDHLISLFARQRFDEGMTVAIALTERYPSNSFAWKALGACLTSTGREAEAIEPMRKAAALNPDDLEAHLNLALALKNQDRMTEAEHSYRQIVRLQPDHVDAHTNLGRILSDRGLFAAAENSYRRALELKPDRFRLHGNLGNVLKAQGCLDEAENSYRRALALKPDYLHAHFNLGVALQDRGRLDEAEHCYRKVIDLKADHVQAYINLGTVLTEQGRLADAEQSNRRALEFKPDYVEAHINLANVLRKQHRLAEAESSNRKALALQPDSVYAHSNLGNILLERKRFKDAESSYCRAIELDPAYAQAHGNLGNTLKEEQGRFSEAEASYRRAIALDADYAQARSNLGILLLSLGRYTEGWPYYEARYDPKQDEKWIALPELPFPQWQGESLVGKSILLWPEQGLGDEIQFARYAPLLKERGVARLTLVCTAPLKTLLQTVAGVDRLITQGEPVPQHDYWAFPLSLPLHLGTTLASIPAALPYLSADPQRVQQWQAHLPEDGLKVGLVWRGNAQHQNDANRSLPGLTSLAPLWTVAGVKFVSLQKGPAEAEAISSPNGQPIVALGEKIHDFADSAALVAQLDLVICVDTSVAHLAGALGKPCWVMLPAVGTDWRWLHERSDSPWYPGVMRLFRQTTPESWDDTIAQVAQALHAWAMRRAGERSNG